MPHPYRHRRGLKPDHRRALELLAASRDGCTEAIMLAHGFTVELIVDLCIAGLVIATVERTVVGGRTVEIVRLKITEAGRQALTGDAINGEIHMKRRASSIRVVRSDGVNGEVSDPRVSGIRPIFVAALAAAVLPTCTQSCDPLSSGQQFPIATDPFAHPMSIYWRDRLFSKMHYPSSRGLTSNDPTEIS